MLSYDKRFACDAVSVFNGLNLEVNIYDMLFYLFFKNTVDFEFLVSAQELLSQYFSLLITVQAQTLLIKIFKLLQSKRIIYGLLYNIMGVPSDWCIALRAARKTWRGFELLFVFHTKTPTFSATECASYILMMLIKCMNSRHIYEMLRKKSHGQKSILYADICMWNSK